MFFHILLWNLYPDACPADVDEGMRRMQRENPQEMKRLTLRCQPPARFRLGSCGKHPAASRRKATAS